MSKLSFIKRQVARAGGGARSFIRWLKSHLLAMVSRKSGDDLTGAVPNSEVLQRLHAILEKRTLLEQQIKASAMQGFLADGLAECLLSSFYDELEARRQLLIELQHELQSVMRRLQAMAPPPKPEPQPDPAPPRPRRFVNFRDWLNGSPGLAK
jgi:hypothetical protein